MPVMNQKQLLLAAAALSVAFGFILMARASDNQAKARPENEEFGGKIVVVFADKEMRIPALVLDGVQIKEFKGRGFLAGTGVDTKRANDWRAGRTIRIALESVTGYFLLTPQEFKEYLEADQDER
jgi:hypothetical protein